MAEREKIFRIYNMKGRKVGIIGSIKKDCVKDRIERRARMI